MSTDLDRYDAQTRTAYRDAARAAAYDRQHSHGFTWARVTMARELAIVRRALQRHGAAAGPVLDVPCGTGVAGSSLAGTTVVAADISREMMAVARDRYASARFLGFAQADITAMPFAAGSFRAAVVLGFMHRVPPEVKQAAAVELARVTSGIVVVSFSVESWAQRIKRGIVRVLKPGHAFPPAPWSRRHIEDLMSSAGFRISRWEAVVPFLSAEVVIVGERQPTTITR